jgi:Fe-S-cluster-containing dehydrogenase component
VCPVAATFVTPDGFVLIDTEHCVSCGYCIQACPYGVRFINEETHNADKCTWCYHRVSKGELPACVNACPTGALTDKYLKLSGSSFTATKVFPDYKA